ncbi:MAG: alpha-amylase family glycosyl hydrolase [bacterium]|nr:alpha-amylase family glycosyl hydrolase [bacterium]
MTRQLQLLTCALLLTLAASRTCAAEITGRCAPPPAPDWTANAVFYQVYPQTFRDTDGDGIGDLNGVIEKLDYIKSLGADGVWLNPFFDSPFNDAGYDIRDYRKVAARYGTNDDARRLFEEAHRRGLRVLFDFVISYTAIDHPWFVESCRQEPNPYSNWYVWNDNTWKMEEGEFANRFIQGYARRNGNFMRNFYWCQPALNFGFAKPDPAKPWQLPVNHPDVLAMREELKSVFRFWMDMGADGMRADMAGALVKGPGSDRETLAFWREIRALADERYPGSFMVSEWSNPKDALDGAFHADFFHWFDGYNDLFQRESWRILNGFSEGHSYFDREGRGDISNFLAKYMDQYEATKDKGYICLPLGNHDNARLNVRRSTAEMEMIMAFGISMPGVPFIYYGNEIGMRQLGSDWPQVEGAYKPRNGARTPMQWAPGPNLGFSSADPSKLYLPVDPAADAPTVAAQEADRSSLLNRVRKLIRIKHDEPALAAYAEFVPLYAEKNAYPFVFARANGRHCLLAVFNPSDAPRTAVFPMNVPYSRTSLLAGSPVRLSRKDGNLTVEVPALSWAWVKLR